MPLNNTLINIPGSEAITDEIAERAPHEPCERYRDVATASLIETSIDQAFCFLSQTVGERAK